MRGLFVTGTDTAAGKTVLSASLLAAMRAGGEQALACKPVLTGLDEDPPPPWPADDQLLALVTGSERTKIAPYRFGPAVSPHLAAELAGTPLDPDELVAGVHAALAGAGVAVVEGVGGLMVPIAGRWLVRDLAVELGLPLVVAARPGLGTISHTLLTLEAARTVGLDVRAVVLTPWPAEPGEIERSNRRTIAELGAVEVSTLEELSGPDPGALARAGSSLPWRQWVAEASGEPSPR